MCRCALSVAAQRIDLKATFEPVGRSVGSARLAAARAMRTDRRRPTPQLDALDDADLDGYLQVSPSPSRAGDAPTAARRNSTNTTYSS